MKTYERSDMLTEIQWEMLDLMQRAKDLVRGTDAEAQANAYWIPHIIMALTNEHEYVGRSMCSMQDTINSLDANECICPGCGLEPGEGLTSGCDDENGCGWARSMHNAPATEAVIRAAKRESVPIVRMGMSKVKPGALLGLPRDW